MVITPAKAEELLATWGQAVIIVSESRKYLDSGNLRYGAAYAWADAYGMAFVLPEAIDPTGPSGPATGHVIRGKAWELADSETLVLTGDKFTVWALWPGGLDNSHEEARECRAYAATRTPAQHRKARKGVVFPLQKTG